MQHMGEPAVDAGMPCVGQMEHATKQLVPWYAAIDGKSAVAGVGLP